MAGCRKIDVPVSVASLLKSYTGDRTSGLLFPNENGLPLSQTNVNRRVLIPTLEQLGVKERGFHAFRRYRTTWLEKQRTPEGLVRFWCGHADRTITDRYSKLDQDLEFRLEVAEKVGVGFSVPASINTLSPLSPQNVIKKETQEAA